MAEEPNTYKRRKIQSRSPSPRDHSSEDQSCSPQDHNHRGQSRERKKPNKVQRSKDGSRDKGKLVTFLIIKYSLYMYSSWILENLGFSK